LTSFGSADNFVRRFKGDEQVMIELLAFAKKEGIVPENKDWKQDAQIIQLYLKANIGRQVYGNDGFYPVVHQRDKAFQAALSYQATP
jgi:carboxyl-terminal processing protease